MVATLAARLHSDTHELVAPVQRALDLSALAVYSASQSTLMCQHLHAEKAVEHREIVMTHWGRRIRGAIGMGLAWAAAGIGVGTLLARVSSFNPDLPFALLFAPLGFAAGVIFSGILVGLEGRRSFDRMSLSRFAGWGAVSGLLLSGIFGVAAALRGDSLWGELLVFGPALATASAVCAAGSLALARRAERRHLSGPNGDRVEAELTEDEKRLRLGRSD